MDDVIYLPSDGQTTMDTYDEPKRPYYPDRCKQIYPRKWSDYFTARQKEKPIALQLLSEAIRILNVKTYGKRTGRPPYPLQDKIFLCVQKVLRSTTYDANEEFIEYSMMKGYITSRPKPHSVADFMGDPQMTLVLENLVVLTSTPLAEIEKDFAVDATGLSTLNRSRWVKVRGEHQLHRYYKKMHTIVGTRTNIITAATVTPGTCHDSPYMVPLIGKMSCCFKIKQMSGDGAYCSRKNAQAVVDIGGVPYFRVRKDVRSLALGYPAWNKMVYSFRKNKVKYEKMYHKRSNVETTYSMFKRKIAEFLKSKSDVAQVNEALCIAVAHNLFVLVNSMFCEGELEAFRD